MKKILYLFFLFVSVSCFSQQNISVGQSDNKYTNSDNYGFVDNNGEFVLKPIYLEARNFSEGLAAVRFKDKNNTRWGYIDKTGMFIIKCNFWFADSFHNGFAKVSYGPEFCGMISNKGKYIITAANIDYVGRMEDGMVMFRKKNKFGFYNDQGDLVIKPTFTQVTDFKEGYARVKVDDFWGFIDKKGKPISEFIFDDAAEFNNGSAVVIYRSRQYKIDKTGKKTLSEPINFRGTPDFLFYETDPILAPFLFSEGLACVKGNKLNQLFKKQ